MSGKGTPELRVYVCADFKHQGAETLSHDNHENFSREERQSGNPENSLHLRGSILRRPICEILSWSALAHNYTLALLHIDHLPELVVGGRGRGRLGVQKLITVPTSFNFDGRRLDELHARFIRLSCGTKQTQRSGGKRLLPA